MRSLTPHSLGVYITHHCHGCTRDHPEKAADANSLPRDIGVELWSVILAATAEKALTFAMRFSHVFVHFIPRCGEYPITSR